MMCDFLFLPFFPFHPVLSFPSCSVLSLLFLPFTPVLSFAGRILILLVINTAGECPVLVQQKKKQKKKGTLQQYL
jgi:hypothetical protein